MSNNGEVVETMAKWWLSLVGKYILGTAYDGIHHMNHQLSL